MLRFFKWFFGVRTTTVEQALAPLFAAQKALTEVVDIRNVEVADKKVEVAKLSEDIRDAEHEVILAVNIKTKLDELLS